MSGIIYPINDKKYTAEDVEIFNCTRTSGVYSVLDFDSVFAGNTVTVGKGLAWIKNGDFSGKAVAFTEETNLTFEAAETAADRYDVIAVRYDAAKKEPELIIIKGSPSDSPKIPPRSTETYLYDLYLYAILRKGGETVISEENITDLRENEEYCGIMRDSVTSGIAPVYETITDERWDVGEIRYFDPERYEFLIAEIHTTIATENVILTRSSSHADAEYYSGIGFYRGQSNPLYYYAQIKIDGNSNELVLCSFVTDMSDDIPETGGNAHITKLVGALKQPEGYVKVDDMYNPKSHNAQSGKAVKQAIAENSAFQVLPTGKNLLNRDTDTVGYNLTETGELTSNGNYEVTDFIPVVESESYRLSDTGVGKSARTMCFYDTHKNVVNFASNLVGTAKIIAPENAKYVRFSFSKSLVNPQFEQNKVVTEYEAFVGKKQIGYNELYIPDKAIPDKALNCITQKSGGKNLLDRTVSEVGKVILATGELGSNSSAETSDFISVAFGDNLYISGTPDGSYATVLVAYTIYDENKQIIKTVINAGTYGENPLPIPRHARFVRYSYRKEGTNIQIERGTEATEYEDYIGVPAIDNNLIGVKMPNDLPYSLNPWSGKRLVVDGDSITHDQDKNDYWQFVAAKLTDMYVDNSDKTTEYANGWKGVGGSRIANELGANDPMYSIVLRYMNLPDEADLVMIAGGTNDWAHDNVLLGDFDSTDDTTFNGALNILLPGLKEKYPTIPVVMMTPIKRGTYGQLNKNGNTQEEFVEALIKKCRQYNIYCLDMWANCPINPNITAMEQLYVKPDGTNDKTHPNTEGHKIMGKTVAGFIRTLS